MSKDFSNSRLFRVFFFIGSGYMAILLLLWVIVLIGGPVGEFKGPLPLWLWWISWPVFVVVLGFLLYSNRELSGTDRLARVLSPILYLAIFGGLIYWNIYTYNRHAFNNAFEDMISRALRSANEQAVDQKNIPLSKGHILTIIQDTFQNDNRPIHEAIGYTINLSSELGSIPKTPQDVGTIVVVERSYYLVAKYTAGQARQWVYRVAVIDPATGTVLAQRSFEGTKPGTPSTKIGQGDFYGEEPWNDIRNWLKGDGQTRLNMSIRG